MDTTPRRRRAPRTRPLAASVFVLLASSGLAIGGAKRGSPDVHHEHHGAGCIACHSAGEQALAEHASVREPMLPGNLDERCAACHDPLDASHQVGVTPKRPVPPTLPLSSAGKITCATCHFMHGESDEFGDFVRIDNRKGALCLTCHELSELE